jgi:hydrogenase maturation protease
MSERTRPIPVIGIGNVLLGDDGVGVRVIDALRALAERDLDAVPPGTRLVDGGTLGLDLLRFFRGARGMVFVDAVELGRSPGTIGVYRNHEIAAAGAKCEGAGAGGGLEELLAVARLMGIVPPAVTLVGVQPGRVWAGTSLTPAVEAAIPATTEVVLGELAAIDREAARLAAEEAADLVLMGPAR